MSIPISTYRIQFTPAFNFEKAKGVISYLSKLGISHIYASPVFKAAKGSHHCYDVVDPNQINPELGGEEGFERLREDVKRNGLFWLQDIVPNHMCFDCENAMLMDVLENGQYSPYYNFFDIEWQHVYDSIRGRLLAPFLGQFYGESLENGEITLRYSENGFAIGYYDLNFPLRIESYTKVLQNDLNLFEERMDKNHPDLIKFMGIIYTFSSLPPVDKTAEYYDQTRLAKKMLWDLYNASEEIKRFIDANVVKFNGAKEDKKSFNLLDDLLSGEMFRLSFWKVANEEINYRRFFSINRLISLRMEDDAVFEHTHKKIFEMLGRNLFDGLRVDHIDGLYDPEGYLKSLKNHCADAYLVVEKILDLNERLPSSWPVHGTTGYDFLNFLNGIFCDRKNERKMSRLYFKFAGSKTSYADLLGEKKKFIIGKHMAGDIDNLAHIIKRVSSLARYGRDITLYGLRRALVEVMASFSVYRTYVRDGQIRKKDVIYIKESVGLARKKNPDLTYEINFLEKFLLMEFGTLLTDEERGLVTSFVMRLQQFTGPLMAKGVEDTFFYVYNRFISLNDVGGNPGVFGVTLKEFHNFQKRRMRHFAHSMNASATHDTKRGEDVRARLNVLSEIPREWEEFVKSFKKINRDKKAILSGVRAPDDNDEYFLYQTLLGAYPFSKGDREVFKSRVKEYVIKAVREAKVHTAWIKPDADYENAYLSFVDSILDDKGSNGFLDEFLLFQKKIAYFGIFNSISQSLLKIASPGVPDFYQGSELWDLNLVDPDNRRPVDYEKRKKILEYIESRQANLHDLLAELVSSMEDGRIKFYLIHRALQTRRAKYDLFNLGEYIPLDSAGKFAKNVVAFARKNEEESALIVVPRFLTSVIKEGQLPFGEEVWGDTNIILPEWAPESFKDVLTEETISSGRIVNVGRIFARFPAAVLISKY